MKRRTAISSLAAMLIGAAAFPLAANAAATGDEHDRLVYFGTHGSGPGQGIFAARFDPATGKLTTLGLAAEVERPTWLVPAAQRGIVYSVSEAGNDGKSEASVLALKADPVTGLLATISKVGSGGGGATHLDLDTRSRTLFVANYGTGQVAALPVRADGGLDPAASVQADYGSGPHRRQTSPHAHGVALAPNGRFLLVPDLGADRTFVYRFDPKSRALSPNDPPFVAAVPGSGPRHVVFLAGGRFAYVNSELTGEITAYRWDGAAGRLTPVRTIPTQAPSYAGAKSSAELASSHDGRFVYVSNRGEDSLVVFRVDRSTGELGEVQRLPAGGQSPWSFTIDPSGGWMLVANEASSLVTVFRIDRATGRLSPTSEALAVPKPVSIAFPRP